MIMSGVEDGSKQKFHSDDDGKMQQGKWILSIGRKDDNDICLNHDTFASRHHANLYLHNGEWKLEDLHSRNGTFIENSQDAFSDTRVQTIVDLQSGQLFRVGRTWLRIQVSEE